MTQLPGHACVWQSCVAFSSGHALPPYCGVAVVTRTRYCDPVQHDAVHPPQLDQSLTEQSIGHTPSVHANVSFVTGHASPLPDDGTVTARARHVEPTPHVSEHAVQGAHAATSHDIVHSEPHGTVSVNSGHAEPPSATAVVVARARTELTPHVAAQADHSPQAPTEQSVGQAAWLHGSVSSSVEVHAPVPTAGDVTVRVRAMVPPRHESEQSDHTAQVATVQSSAQTTAPEHARARIYFRRLFGACRRRTPRG